MVIQMSCRLRFWFGWYRSRNRGLVGDALPAQWDVDELEAVKEGIVREDKASVSHGYLRRYLMTRYLYTKGGSLFYVKSAYLLGHCTRKPSQNTYWALAS